MRRVSDGQPVFSGATVAWKNGVTHTQSGDRGWWFDFSALSTPGEYYLFDVAQCISSHPFRIDEGVYRDVLKQAVRTYFYQRLNFAKQTPFTDSKWTDLAAFDGAGQDKEARSRWAKNDPATARNLRGGWMDAGDVNKYTTFAEGAVLQLLEAYRRNPAAFTDDFNIPESGNGIPDLLDELIWELDFLKRMQDATGTGGFLLKVGVDNYNDISPPSLDTRPRYYLPECTSATLAGCAMFAMAGVVLAQTGDPALQTYAADLVARAQAAWQRATVSTANFTQFESACDDGDIKAGDADRDALTQLESALIAAIYLYEATDNAAYQQFTESKYTQTRPISSTWWGPYQAPLQYALLRYAGLPGANANVAATIRNQKAAMNYAFSIDTYAGQTDLYRAHMDDWAHHWGSNLVRANCGTLNMDFIYFSLNPAQSAAYREVAAQYLHWLHGANPLGMVMLSNMYAFGGDWCANQIYHTWFGHNTLYDHALFSPRGPAPGYLTGGPNKDFSYTQLSPPANQPPQKSYLDFNDGWPQSSWEITEPAIYYNAAYILLLSNFTYAALVPAWEVPVAARPFELRPNPASSSVQLKFSDGRSRVVRVVNASGQVIETFKTIENQITLDIKHLPSGAYRIGADGVWKQMVKL
ncbi:MAG: glycoside hydrolase family 9 protein [Saprospirales bacterium]|nr:glycoside hydrolase family 9 protein [Saprospirales bacterium]